jgi:segregation and condensation protein A
MLALAPANDEAFNVDVDGFEGPLDLLLTLARKQQVDLRHVSILALADQYLSFIDEIRKTRLELAADYLVMAAWLAYLKSRLLLPNPTKLNEPSGEVLAETLQAKLLRLNIIREAAARLMTRPRLGRDVFARGDIEPMIITRKQSFECTLYELLTAYAKQRRKADAEVLVTARTVMSLREARELLEKLIGLTIEWTSIETFLADYLTTEENRTTIRASSFSAMLEMVKEGSAEISQEATFAPIFIRTKTPD